MLTSHKQIDKSRLGRLLVNRGYISQAQLDDALALQRQKGVLLGQVLMEQGLISEKDLSRTLKHQERYRYAAALVAVVVSPLQPMLALASGSAGAMVPESRPSTSQLAGFTKASGLQPMDDEEMGSVTAQGLVEDVKWLTQVVQNAKEGKDQSTDDSNEIGQVKMMAHILLPVSNFLDSKTTVEGVRYDTDQLTRFNPDGSIQLAFPSHIDRIAMEDIRPAGSSGATFGSLYFTDVNMQMDVTIRPRL